MIYVMISRIARCICVLGAMVSTSAVAQTTQPTQPVSTWPAAVQRLADAVRGKDFKSLTAVLEDSPFIRNFESERVQTPEKLLGLTSGATLLGAHAYTQPPTTLATDLAADVQTAAGVPEPVRDAMTPPDDQSAKRANETALQWLMQILTPTKEQVVGVIVLWPNERHDSLATTRKRPLFVLVKGERAGEGFRLKQVVFGDPLDSSH